MSAILVTGGAGFIGSHLCERLVGLDREVICLDNFNNNYDPSVKRANIQKALQHPRFELIEGDILDHHRIENVMAGRNIDTVVHLAALAGVRGSIRTPADYVDVDIKGTVMLLEACKKHGVRRFVFASSSSVYGTCRPPFREDLPITAQTSPYAVAKYSGELFCRMYSLLFGIQAVCLRFFTVYGPRQRPDMAIHIFTRAIEEGREICIYGDGNSSRDYTYVGDIVDGIAASMNLQCSFETINLGNSRPVGIMDLVKVIESKVGRKAMIRFIPEQQGDVPATRADLSRAAALLGYSPKVELAEGIEKFVKWRRQASESQ